MTALDNPAAFPSQLREATEPGEHDPQPGMTLRDWFAAHASEADIDSHRLVDFVDGEFEARTSREEARYAYADAMLAMRRAGA